MIRRVSFASKYLLRFLWLTMEFAIFGYFSCSLLGFCWSKRFWCSGSLSQCCFMTCKIAKQAFDRKSQCNRLGHQKSWNMQISRMGIGQPTNQLELEAQTESFWYLLVSELKMVLWPPNWQLLLRTLSDDQSKTSALPPCPLVSTNLHRKWSLQTRCVLSCWDPPC